MNRAGRSHPDPAAPALAEMDRAAARLRRRMLREQAQAYDRRRHLPRLIFVPRQVRTLPEPDQTRAIIGRLKRALRLNLALRARRDWSYSRYRHAALVAALGGELMRLRSLRQSDGESS
jgi:hypothetical protein